MLGVMEQCVVVGVALGGSLEVVTGAGLPSEGLMASCKLQEQIFIQLLPSGPLTGGQENVAPDVLMHDAAAGRHTAEGHIDVFIELNGHLQVGCHRSSGLG